MTPVALHARETGLPAAPPVLLLHGLFGSSTNWGRVSRALAGDWRVLVPDLRNHGQSPHAEPHDYPAMAADLVALMDRHSIDAATLVGHSMGGKVAMHLALTAPGRVARLAVVDMAPVRYTHDFDDVLAAFDAVDLDAIGSRADAEAAMAARIELPGVRAFLLQNLVRDPAGAWQWRLSLPALRRAQPDLLGFPDIAAGAAYVGPTRFIHGERSDYLQPAHEPRVRELFPNASVCTVAGAGHWVYAEAPDGFLDCLRPLLDERPPAAIDLRDVSASDVDAVNRVIAVAIDGWDIAPRIKRLALPSYQYAVDDFAHLAFVGAWRGDELLGFVSLEPADVRQVPHGRPAMLVHGLFVQPRAQGIGVGRRLVEAVMDLARERGAAGLLVRAERNARGFFEKVGFAALPVEDTQRDYPHRLWADLDTR
jgi:esterase